MIHLLIGAIPDRFTVGESRYAYRHGIRRSRLVQLRDGTELKRGAELGESWGRLGAAVAPICKIHIYFFDKCLHFERHLDANG